MQKLVSWDRDSPEHQRQWSHSDRSCWGWGGLMNALFVDKKAYSDVLQMTLR